ncbi:hypothetical protein D3C87_790650 [compost metagenome]
MLKLCEAQPDLSGAHFFAVGKALAKNSGNGGRISCHNFNLYIKYSCGWRKNKMELRKLPRQRQEEVLCLR